MASAGFAQVPGAHDLETLTSNVIPSVKQANLRVPRDLSHTLVLLSLSLMPAGSRELPETWQGREPRASKSWETMNKQLGVF